MWNNIYHLRKVIQEQIDSWREVRYDVNTRDEFLEKIAYEVLYLVRVKRKDPYMCIVINDVNNRYKCKLKNLEESVHIEITVNLRGDATKSKNAYKYIPKNSVMQSRMPLYVIKIAIIKMLRSLSI